MPRYNHILSVGMTLVIRFVYLVIAPSHDRGTGPITAAIARACKVSDFLLLFGIDVWDEDEAESHHVWSRRHSA